MRLTLPKIASGEIDGAVSDRDVQDHQKGLRKYDKQEREDDLDTRKQFSSVSIGIMQSWVGFLIVLVIAQFSLEPLGLGLEPAEFIAVITTTTAAVFGFGVIVGNYLFPKGGSDRRARK